MYVALKISSSNIKILSLQGRQVKKWASLALPGGAVRDGLILQPESVGEAINTLFKSTRISQRKGHYQPGRAFLYLPVPEPAPRETLPPG